MTLLDEVLTFNEKFVSEGQYAEYETGKFPDKRMVLVSCMDTRLVELLPESMNIKNGDVKLIKTAGAIVSEPYGSTMSSVLVAVYELQADEVFVVAHHDCGMSAVNVEKMIGKMIDRGISQETIEKVENNGIQLHNWIRGFDNVYESVKNSVKVIKTHPLLPADVPVHGLVIAPDTGKLEVVVNGYE